MVELEKAVDEQSAETIAEGLKGYAIGEKLRRLRQKRNLGLVELGKHTGLSPAMLSKLENGRVIPTLPTLLRIAMVFSVGIDHFFTADSMKRFGIVKKDERIEFPEANGGEAAAYRFQCLDYRVVERKSNAYFAVFESKAAGEVRRHVHPGSEFLYVLRGCLGLTYEDHEYTLEAGDSVYLEGGYSHGYRRIGGEPCEAIVVTVPS